MTPGGAMAQQAQLNQMLESIRKGKDDAYRELENVRSKVNKFLWIAGTASAVPILGPIGPATVWWVYSNWEKIKAFCEKIFKVLETVIRNGTPVLSLIHHSFAWVETVMKPTSALVYEVGERANLNLMEWSGRPAERYKEIQTQQKAALNEMVTRSNHISKWTITIVQGNLKYAEQVYKIVTGLVKALVEAVVEAAGVVTVPLVVETLGDQLGRIIEAELNLLMTIAQRVVDSLAGQRDAISISGNQSILGPTGWPEAVRGG